MTPSEYLTAITTLNLSQTQAAHWLGVSLKTARTYATKGPSGPASRAVGMAVALSGLEVVAVTYDKWPAYDPLVRHSDLTAAVGLPS